MLTKRVKWHIVLRFGQPVNYLNLIYIYYDRKSEKFANYGNYYRWSIIPLEYVGYVFGLLFPFMLVSRGDLLEQIPEEVGPSDQHTTQANTDDSEILIMFNATLYWVVLTQLTAIGSLLVQYGDCFASGLNQVFLVDERLHQVFLGKQMILIPQHMIKVIEVVIVVACWGTCAVPLLFMGAVLHPAEPIHRILEDLFEIEVKMSAQFIPIWIVYTAGIYPVMSMALVAGIHYLLACFLCYLWFIVLVPDCRTNPARRAGQWYFQLQGFSQAFGEDELIGIYRTFQVFSALMNGFMAKIRYALHAACFLIGSVICAYALIRYNSLFFGDDSFSSYSMGIMLIIAGILAPAIFLAECNLTEHVVRKTIQYRNSLLNKTSRKSRIRKAACSFWPVRLRTTYPFFNVNNSSFLEYMGIGVDNLVSLLVSY